MPTTQPRKLRVVERAPVEGEEPAGGRVRIAFATHDLKTMDAHFGGARNLAIYSVTAEDAFFVEAIRFDVASNEDGTHADGDEDRITPRVDALDGCALLFVLAIGGPAAAKVVSRRIHPVKLKEPEPIEQVIERVQAMLKTSPPPWLRKAIGAGKAHPSHFLDDDQEQPA